MKNPFFSFEFLDELPWRPKRKMFRLEVQSKEIDLLAIKDFIQRICDVAGCGPKESAGIRLAVDEACSNIIRHAYKGREDGRILLEVGVGLSDLKIKIVDFGQPFDFKGIKDPDLNHYVDIGKKGGLGIWLIKKIMSKVVYRSYPDHNELILYRELAKAPPKELGLKQGPWSVSAKFTLGSVVLVGLLIVSVYVFLAYRQETFVAGQQRSNSVLLTQTMASEAGAMVWQKKDLELDRLIREVVRQDKDKILSYAFIVGADGRYLAHSDLNQLFKPYVPAPGMKSPAKPGVQVAHLIMSSDTEDYASAIFFNGKKVGEVHLGVSESAIQGQVQKVQSDFRKLVLLILIVCIAGLYFLSNIVIRPFRKILDGFQAVSSGQLGAKIDLDSQDEFGQLATIFNEMTAHLQESQKGVVEQERLQKEMQVAQEIQHTLLPNQFPEIEGYEIGATYRAAKEVGGDYYDFFWVDPTSMGIVVADVSGKGVPGSMVMTMIRTAMRLEARGNKSAADVLAKVNAHVTSDMKRGMFVTMFYIVLDSRNRAINFASAGHNPMILYRGKTQQVYFLKPKGFPVGIDLPEEDMFAKNIDLQKVSLEKNDILIIYTDGITEAMDPDKKQFGEERLVQVIKENAHLTAPEFVEKLNEAIAQFTRGAEQNDDITLVAIKEKMQAEQVVFKFRKKLLDLVGKKGLSIAEACRRMNISPKTYYRYKKLFDEQGHKGLKLKGNNKRRGLKELTLSEKQSVMSIVKEHPEYGVKQIVEFLGKSYNPPVIVERNLVLAYLKRKGLSNSEERKSFSANEVDTI